MSHRSGPRRLLLVSAAVCLLTILPPGSAVAAGPDSGEVSKPNSANLAHDATQPGIMREAAVGMATAAVGSLTPRNPVTPLKPRNPANGQSVIGPAAPNAVGPQRQVFAFATAGSLGDPSLGYPSWNLSLLSTVAFFGLHVNADNGSLVQGDTGWNVWHSSVASTFLNLAHSNGVRVVLTIIYQDPGQGMCAALNNGAATASAARQQLLGADGINIDYEGVNQTCPDGIDLRSKMNQFVQVMRSAGIGDLSVDTYASSAEDTSGFFDIPTLAGSVDSLFVMAYGLDASNLPCCMVPTSPLAGYTWTVTRAANAYAPWAAKSILGLPYYGVKGCVTSSSPNAPLASPSKYGADSYVTIASYRSDPNITGWSESRDPRDPGGQEPLANYFSGYAGCPRQEYWDDATSLSQKYALVLQHGMKGAGIFALDYGAGAPDLWAALCTYFSAPAVTASVAGTQSTTRFAVDFTPTTGCGVTGYDVLQLDVNLGQAFQVYTGVNGTTSAVVDGYPGHIYVFQVRSRTAAGLTGPWSSAVSTTVASTATYSQEPWFKGLYVLDAYGGIHSAASPPLGISAYWWGWDIARAAVALPGQAYPQSGLVLDGYGGLHPYGAGLQVNGGDYFGWDIARDLQFLPDGSGGYVLDGYGGFHPFGVGGHPPPPAPEGAAYWAGFDIARKLVIFSDGTGGYVLDGWGGVHAFGIGHPRPPDPYASAYWPGWAIARSIALIPGTHSGYVLDGYGALHQVAAPGDPMPPPLSVPYFGWDIARGIFVSQSSTASQPLGYTIDGYGGLHPFGGGYGPYPAAYWSGWDIVKGIFGA
jgi:spore germination protein YaaH